MNASVFQAGSKIVARPALCPGVCRGWLAALLALAGAHLLAEDARTPGHSMHGEAFNEGPRQAAWLMDGMPKVHFSVTTHSTDAQAFFDQGLGQLHGFWYFEAERSFRQAYALDTNCVMALWGMAMANVNNGTRAKQFIATAAGRTNDVSPREALWIAGLHEYRRDDKDGEKRDEKTRRRDYVRALENLVQQQPDDVEAKAFLAYQIWDNAGFGNERSLPITSHQAVDTLLDQIFARAPLHPAHHYRIHLWDNEKPERALASAFAGGPSGPGIAHLWHMPGHTFDKLARYPDVAFQQEASACVDHAHLIRARLLPDQIFNYGHNNSWLCRTYRDLGRARDAVALAKNLIELPRHPKLNALEKDAGSAAIGRRTLVRTLVDFELWDELIACADGFHLERSGDWRADAWRAYGLGLAALQTGNTNRFTEQLAAFDAFTKEARQARYQKADEAEASARRGKKSGDEITRAMAEALSQNSETVRSVEQLQAELRAWEAAFRRDTNSVAEQLELTADLPDETKARLWLLAGDLEKAVRFADDADKKSTNRVPVLAARVEVLWRGGRTNEIRPAFDKLRGAAAFVDLDLPVVRRLAPLARELGLPEDWRPSYNAPADVPSRPGLDVLGPLHWHPAKAPPWSFAGADSNRVASADYRGRPVLLLFFLGGRCSHCVEQLKSFAAVAKDFESADIHILAISPEPPEELKYAHQNSQRPDGLPFPVLSDAPLDGFKAFHAYDDFEQIPIHGTVLIDGEGWQRWQDIGAEPFTDAKFLLGEAKRLLRQPAPQLAHR